MARFDVNGSLDRSFGDRGGVLLGAKRPVSDKYLRVRVVHDDGTVTTRHGKRSLDDIPEDIGIAEIPAGKLGITHLGGNVAVAPDGKIVVAGVDDTDSINQGDPIDFMVVRLNRGGSLDTSFGDSGRYATSAFGFVGVPKIAIASDGKVVFGGHAGASEAASEWTGCSRARAGR